MAIPVTPKPQYPAVPQVPGVPSIPRQVGASFNAPVLVISDILTALSLFLTPQWGIFDQGGAPIIVANSVTELEFKREKRISTAPQEQGAFLSYNKVADPFQGRVTYVQGGTNAERNAFLASVQAAEDSLDLYNLVMPDFTYQNINVVHHDFRRTVRRGITLLAIDVWVEEVRVAGPSMFTQTAQPSGSATVNGGTVQPAAPTAGVPTSVQPNGLPAGALT